MSESNRPFSSLHSTRDVRQEVNDELNLHLALKIEELIASGMTPEQARDAAQRHFGRLDAHRADCTRIGLTRLRAKRRADWWRQFVQDMRIGAHGLARQPGFTWLAVLILALGIGVNTAMFSVIHAVFLRPLPFTDPDRIVTLWQSNPSEGAWREGVSLPNFKDWRDQSTSFESMALIQPFSFDLLGSGEPVSVSASLVTTDFFRVLGVDALHGRTIQPEDVQSGRQDLAVISHRFWNRQFGADPGCVGQTIQFDGQDVTIIGVMPPSFEFPAERDVWAPLDEQERLHRRVNYMQVIARLKPDVDPATAQADLDGVATRLAQLYPSTNEGSGIALVPLHGRLVEHVRPALLTLYAAVAAVLFIACFNVMQLHLVRGTQRRRELAVRAALGAGRGRLIRQLLTESFLLSCLAGAVGWALAMAGVAAIRHYTPTRVPHLEHATLDATVTGYALGIVAVAALLCGIIPALRASRLNLSDAMREAGATTTFGRSRARLGNVLVVGEVGTAVVLLVGAGLLIRSFVSLINVDPGFRPERIVAMELHAFGDRSPAQRAQFYHELEERLAALPGVAAVGSASMPPFHEMSIDVDTTFSITGRGETTDDTPPKIFLNSITPGYVAAAQIPLIEGRLLNDLDATDNGAEPVVLINDTVARRHFPDESPVGQTITLALAPDTPMRIVGVIGSVLHTGLDTAAWPECFIHHARSPSGSMVMLARTDGDPLGMVPAIKSAVWAIDPALPISHLDLLDDLVDASVAQRRFTTILLTGMAALAMLLACLGLYGVIAYSVSQRTREIGLRMALGARARTILVQVLRQGAALAVIGLFLGIAAAGSLARLLESQLYHVSSTDPATYVLLSLVFLLVAIGACYLPARRATKVAPMVALRNE